MFHGYEPNVKATIAFLKLLRVSVNDFTVNETLQNHPDWPSLLCVSDSLNKWKLPNAAGRVDKSEIRQLPVPFIAYTHNPEYPLAVVTYTDENSVHYKSKSYGKKDIVETKEDFLKKWDGIYLMAEPNEYSGEPGYETNRRKAFFNSLIPAGAFISLTILLSLALTRVAAGVSTATGFSTTGFYLQYSILLSGIIVTSLLLWYEIDKNNPLLQKVCTGMVKGDCNAILTGKQSKLFGWLRWSELGFFYFSGGLLVLLSAGNAVHRAVSLLAWLNILALPYIVFSVYYQWRVAKQWCVLCLAVQALLFLGATNALVHGFLIPFSSLPVSFIASVLLLYLLPALVWYAVKPYILRLQGAKNTKREYLRIKFNAEIFDTLLKKQKPITASAEGLGISLGSPTATHELIKVCNPYCGPCAKAHPKIEALLEQHSDLKARIIFTVPNEEDNVMIKPVKHLLAIDEKKDEAITKRALDDWYLPEKKDYDLFALKYPMNGELSRQGFRVEAMSKWCKEMKVSVTPTIFINGYQLPDAYSIEDLQYFLLE